MEDALDTSISLWKEHRYSEALEIWRELADSGDAMSMYMIGAMYDDGTGVEKDLSQAFYWFDKASEFGAVGAHYCIGSMYYRGDFVQQDFEKAAHRYKLDADQDYPLAQYSLGYMYEFGEFFKKDLVTAAIWYSLAADHGIEDAKKGVKRVMPTLTSGERAAVHASCVKWLKNFNAD